MQLVVLVASVSLAGLAHLVAGLASARARERYAEIMSTCNKADRGVLLPGSGSEMTKALLIQSSERRLSNPSESPTDIWHEVRPYVGLWGCFFFGMVFLRSAALLVALGAGIWYFFG